MKRALAAIGLSWMAACGGASKPAPERDPAPAHQASDHALDELAAVKTEVCACRTATCLQHAQDDFDAWAKAHEHTNGSQAQADRVTAIAADISSCMQAVMMQPMTAGPGLDDCDAYVGTVETYQRCDKAARADRDAAQQHLDVMRQGWRDAARMTDAQRDTLDEQCIIAIAEVSQSLDAAGCPK